MTISFCGSRRTMKISSETEIGLEDKPRMIVTVRPSLCRIALMSRRNVHCGGTRYSGSVTHTAEDD